MAIQNDGGGNVTTNRTKKVTSPVSTKPLSIRQMNTPAVPSITPKAPSYAPQSGSFTPISGMTDTFGAAGGADGGMSDDDYLASGADSAYSAQIAALMRALEGQQADSTAQRSKYEVDYGSTLKNLGWNQDDPSTPDVDEGAWNFSDTNTAAGRAFQNQQNDFAGRGLLQSSLYGTANDNLTRSLNDQLGGINTSKQSFFDDLTRQGTAFQNDNTFAQQQARAEALQRRAGQIAL